MWFVSFLEFMGRYFYLALSLIQNNGQAFIR